MYVYECEKCGWKGNKEEVNWVYGHEFMNVEEPENEEDWECICVCPKCEPLTMTYEYKI